VEETMTEGIGDAPASPSSHLHVWDSQYGPSTEAFSFFRETICSEFMPWSPEFYGSHFEGRVESISFENGAVGRVRMSPIVAIKTKRDIANSPMECIHGNLILGGQLKVEQGGRTNIAKPGDLVLYQSYSPVTLTEQPDTPCDNLAFIIPKSQFAAMPNVDECFSNSILTSDKLIGPLSSCLAMIAKNLCSASAEELASLFTACITLLPLSAGLDGGKKRKAEISQSSHMLRELLSYIDRNLSSPELSPNMAAEYLRVSVRYIHKLFAHSGTTFSAYVTAERLERIRWDLIASSGRRPPISGLAYRWGFSDLSTFNRAFKSRFGCTPSQLGSRGAG
jgi:AraC-like DNA-binding protein